MDSNNQAHSGIKLLSRYGGGVCYNMCSSCAAAALPIPDEGPMTSQLHCCSCQGLYGQPAVSFYLQGVYDKLCDMSLILKSVVLHASHLTSICIDQGATVSAKAVASLVEMPALTSLTIKTAHGFETGKALQAAMLTFQEDATSSTAAVAGVTWQVWSLALLALGWHILPAATPAVATVQTHTNMLM